jgi:hypothetical protein
MLKMRTYKSVRLRSAFGTMARAMRSVAMDGGRTSTAVKIGARESCDP